MDVRIRPESPTDRAADHALNSAAFGQAAEAELVDALRDEAGVVSIVAQVKAQLVGHILFYYPRFGFAPAASRRIDCEYEVPSEAFVLLELQPGYLRGASGTIRYHAAFGAVS